MNRTARRHFMAPAGEYRWEAIDNPRVADPEYLGRPQVQDPPSTDRRGGPAGTSAATDRNYPAAGLCASLLTHIVESFALCGAALYPTGLYPIDWNESRSQSPKASVLHNPAPEPLLFGGMNATDDAGYGADRVTSGGPGAASQANRPADPQGGARPRIVPSRYAGWTGRVMARIATLRMHPRRARGIAGTRSILSGLDDRTLRDLGIERGQIEVVARYGREWD
jgi:uncharacterized protein YjiS (DUF1127 family)